MAIQTKIRRIGNSLGIVLPKEAIQHLRVEEGQAVYLTEAPGGSLHVNVGSEAFAEKMRIADSLMRRYQNALRELAK